MPDTQATLAAIIKELVPQKRVESIFFGSSALYDRIPKDDNAEGNPIRVAMIIAPNGGRSATFANADADAGNTTATMFQLTTADDYAVFRVAGKLLRSTKGERGAIVQGLKVATDSAMYNIKKSMYRALYRDTFGVIGRIASGADGTTLTLTDPTDTFNMEVGDYLVSSAQSDGTSMSTNTGIIGSIDRAAGTITVAGGGNWHADFDTNDYLYHHGDAAARLAGLASWLPASTPASTAFFGVNRTTDPTRLAGIRYTASLATDQTLVGTFINAAATVMNANGSPSDIFMNPLDYAILIRELQDQCTYERLNARGGNGEEIPHIGFKALQLVGIGKQGTMNIMADPYCPRHRAYMLSLEHWKLYAYAGLMPGFLKEDGLTIRADAALDSYSGRFGVHWQLGCEAPGWNATINLSAITNPS